MIDGHNEESLAKIKALVRTVPPSPTENMTVMLALSICYVVARKGSGEIPGLARDVLDDWFTGKSVVRKKQR